MNVEFPSLGLIGASITTPVALVGFLVASISIIYLALIRAKRKLIESLPAHQRAGLVDEQLTRYKVEFTNLTAEQKLELVKQAMKTRANGPRFFAVLGAVVFLASFGMTIHGSRPKVNSPTPDPNERVLYYKAQILGLRGDIEAKSGTLETDLRQRGLQLADLIGEIDEGQLRQAIKIIQHEYRGWAFLMGVSTFAETPPEYISAASRIDYATKAVTEFDLALDRMADITRDYRSSVPAAIPIYEWMTGPSEDLNRTHYLKAVALAVIARADGGTPQAAIAELSAIKPAYLVTFPAENNPDLAWALSQSISNRSSVDHGP